MTVINTSGFSPCVRDENETNKESHTFFLIFISKFCLVLQKQVFRIKSNGLSYRHVSKLIGKRKITHIQKGIFTFAYYEPFHPKNGVVKFKMHTMCAAFRRAESVQYMPIQRKFKKIKELSFYKKNTAGIQSETCFRCNKIHIRNLLMILKLT